MSKKTDKGSTERFGYEWEHYDKIIPEYEFQFLKWVNPLKKSDFKGKKILDAGCGIGRNSYWPLKYGCKEAVAIDYDKRTVESAKKNLSEFNNAQVKFGSIYDIDYKDYFDISYSIGVIHHLEFPKKAIASLIKATKSKGKVLIWVYGYEGNEWIVRYINPIRKITSKLPVKFTHYISYIFSIPLYFYIKFLNPKGAYLRQLSGFRFWHTHSIVFDQLIPKIANYWKKSEVIDLFKSQGLTNLKISKINNLSWTIIGEKK